ncbi:MAG: hypothetical protein KJ711_08480 [Candidatus Omnitrophica bacterium]|nr:hypothetical protein [Candidatus Omnitrophota bacterium]
MRANLKLSGTQDQTITQNAGSIQYGTWTADKVSGLATQLNNLNIGGSLNINQGIFSCNGYNLIVSGAFSIDGILRVQGGEVLTFTKDTDSGTVEYIGKDSINYASLNYGNNYRHLIINSTSGGDSFSPNGALSLGGNLAISSGILDLAGNNLTLAVTSNFSNTGKLRLLGSETLSPTPFPNDTNSGTVEYYGAGLYPALIAGNTYWHLIFAGAGTYKLANALSLGGNLSITDSQATLDLNGNNLTLAASSQFENAGILKLIGSETLSPSPFPNDTNSGTVQYYGISSYTGLKAGDNYYDLTFSSATGIYTLTAGVDINNNLTFITTPSLNTGTYSITVGGNFTNSSGAAVLSGTGTVIFDTADKISTISGSTTFYNLTCATAGKTLKFEATKTQTITNNLTLTGAEGSLINLRSTLDTGTDLEKQWKIDPQVGRSVSYVDVKDSNNVNALIIGPTNSFSSGNNTNWDFTNLLFLSGTVYSDRGLTLIGSGKQIALVINGVSKAPVTTDADSNYNFANISFSAGDALLLYITGDTIKGNLLTIIQENTISGLDIYGNTLIASYESSGPVTNAVFDTAKGLLTDTDIIYSVEAGNLTISGANDFLIWTAKSYEPGGNITIPGSFINQGTFTPATYTVTLTATDTDNIITSAGASFNNLIINGAGGEWDLQDSLDVNSNLVITKGILDLNGKNLDLTGAVFSNDGILKLVGSETVTIPTFDTSSGTVEYYGSGSYSTLIAGNAYYDLTFNNAAATWSLPANLDVNNDFILTAGKVEAGTFNVNVGGNWENSGGTFDAGTSMVIFDATDTDNIITSAGTSFNNLTIDGTGGVWTLQDAMDVNSALTITDGTLDLNGKNLDLTGASFENQGILKLIGSETVTIPTFDTNSGTVEYYGAGSYSTLIASNTYYDLAFNNAASIWSLPANLDVNNNWTLTAGKVQARTWTINVGGNWENSGTFDAGSSTVNFDGTSTQNLNPGTSSFWKLIISNTSATTVHIISNDLLVSDALTISSASVLDLGDKNLIAPTATFSNSGTLKLTGAQLSTDFTNDLTQGTVEYTGSGDYSVLATGDNYYNLTISGSGTFTPSSSLDLRGNFTQSAGTFDSPSTMTIGGNFNHPSGTFNHNSGTVILDDVNKPARIYGSSTFYNLTCQTLNKTLQFQPGSTQTIAGELTLAGEPSNRVALKSITAGSAWAINALGAQTVYHLEVKDGQSLGEVITVEGDYLDSGGNSGNWVFISYFYWIASSNSIWNNGDNWSRVSGGSPASVVPASADAAVFDSGVINCTLDAAVTISKLNLTAGYSGSIIANSSLTINGDFIQSGGTFVQGENITVTLVGNLFLNGQAVWSKIATAETIFSSPGTKTWSDTTATSQDIGVVRVTGGSSTPNLNISGSVKSTSLFIDTFNAVTMGENSSLALTGGGTPLTGGGSLDTLTYTPNTIQYIGEAGTNITSAAPLNAYYNLTIGPISPASPASLTFQAGEDHPYSAVIDEAGGFAYFGMALSPGVVVKVRLSDLTRVGVLTLGSGENYLYSAVIDPAAGFAYFGTYTAPAKVIKVNLANFTREAALILNSGEDYFYTGVIDAQNDFAYFGTYTSAAKVIKINLDPLNFSRVAALTLNSGENNLTSSVIDTTGGFAYFGTNTSPGKVVKINLSSFGRASAVTLPASQGEDYLTSGVIDTTNGFAYFGTNTSPGKVIKVDLDPFSRTAALTLNSGEDYLTSGVLDTAGGFVYFGTNTQAGKIVKLNTASFTQGRTQTLSLGEDYLRVGLIDTVNNYLYFGTNTSPGRVIKMCLAGTATLGTASGQTLTVNGDLTVSECFLNVNSFDPAITLKGSLAINSGAYWQKSDSASLTWAAEGPKTFIDNTPLKQDLGGVVISGGTNSPQVNLASDIRVTSLNIASGHTVDLAGYGLTLSGDFTNQGTLRLKNEETLTGFSNYTTAGTIEYYGEGTDYEDI